MRPHPLAPWLVLALLAFGIALAPARAGDDRPPAAAPAAAHPGESPAAAYAEDAAAASDELEFVRFSDDGEGGGTLDTAIATYQNAAGVAVHLVAAVHVGEKAYYKGLSDTFDTYDALLYELVKPRDAAVSAAAAPAAAENEPGAGDERDVPQVRGAAAIGGLQSMLKNVLKLEFQLEHINYDRPNFVHADLDVETFNEMQAARGESLFRLMLRSMMHEMSRQRRGEGRAGAQVTLFDLLAAMRSPDSARQYKLLFARQMQDIEAQLEGIEGKDGSVIIAERNKAALRVLERTIGEGKRNIGVFYGAGHMRGIEDALLSEMGFKRTGVEWRVAWDMRDAGEIEGMREAGKAADAGHQK